MTRLQEYYQESVVPSLMEQFKYSSVMQVPRITKITLNMGVGEAIADKKVMEAAVNDLTRIAGQKPVVTKARKSVAAFKIREGWPIGCKVTLRRDRMYEFLDRLISVAFPRVRDFRGVSARAFDGRGNFSVGFKEQIVFPEIDYDKVDAIRGLDVTITTTAQTNEEGEALPTNIDIPGCINLENIGLRITTKLVTNHFKSQYSNRPNRAYLDYDKTGAQIRVRFFRPGDRFVPLGMKGSKKLKSFFIDEKVPQNERKLVPILTSQDDDIIWVYEKRIAENYRVTDKTRRVLLVEGESS